MQYILLFLGCCALVGCSQDPNPKYLDGNPRLAATMGVFTPPDMNFWPPDIIPHPHPPQPEPKDPCPMA